MLSVDPSVTNTQKSVPVTEFVNLIIERLSGVDYRPEPLTESYFHSTRRATLSEDAIPLPYSFLNRPRNTCVGRSPPLLCGKVKALPVTIAC